MTETRLLYAAALLFTAAGAALRLAPVTAPDPAGAAPGVAGASAATASPRLPEVAVDRYAAIVTSNAFSPRRAPPATRFVPEGMRRDTQTVARPAPKPREAELRLYGITRGPGGAVALIDADPAVPGDTSPYGNSYTSCNACRRDSSTNCGFRSRSRERRVAWQSHATAAVPPAHEASPR